MTSPGRRLTSMNSQLPQIKEEDSIESFRREIDNTLGTAETRQPRNAFAEEDLRVHRHRLAGNAFYQEQYSRRKHTPPTVIHPAFRYDTDIYNIARPLPELDLAHRPMREMEQVSPQVSPLHVRDNRNTTMSPFINAGDFDNDASSPPLKLAPSPNPNHVTTLRNELEQRSAAVGDETITVTRPSPKVANQDFGHNSQQFENKSPASPKKSLLDRFRVGNRRGAVPLKSLPPMTTADGSPNMPAKARAVLVSIPPSQSVARSPSKTKGFWSRRKPSIAGDDECTTVTPVLKVPPHDAHPIYSRNARSHSLGYMDNAVPPTPPMKDTPPDERARQEAVSAGLIPGQDDTPSRKTGSVSLTSRTSPNKYATLVTKPNTRSFRASIVPDVMYGHDLEDTKDRINGLGLAGCSVSDEKRPSYEQYSPSIYSPDLGNESRATFTPVAAIKHKKSKSASNAGTSDVTSYPIIYPELARNPSIRAFATPPNKVTPDKVKTALSDSSATVHPYAQYLREERVPAPHRDGIEVVINEVDNMLGDGGPSPSTSSLFAIPLGHASAQVSPLHVQPAVFSRSGCQRTSPDLRPILRNSEGQQILPATTYKAQNVRRLSNHSSSREPHLARGNASQNGDKKSTQAMPGLEYDIGVDVDPKKVLAKDAMTSRHSGTSSSPWATVPKGEKHLTQTDPQTGSPNAAGLSATDRMGVRDNRVKELITSYQQADIGKRLSDLEESMKQEAQSVRTDRSTNSHITTANILFQRSVSEQEERRRFEQEVMFVSTSSIVLFFSL